MVGKTVLISGANRGLGLGLAKHYVSNGWQVIATARNPDKADELKKLNPWKLLPLDTSDEASISNLASSLKDIPIDVLINNSGIMNPLSLHDTTKDEMIRHFEVNVVGAFLMTRALLPNLKLSVKQNGTAIAAQMSSRAGSIGDNGSGSNYSYRASKSALNMIQKSLSVDLKDEKITCLSLHPGFVNTDMTKHQGMIDVPESVEGLTSILDKATFEDTGKFFHYKGEELPW